MKVGKLTHKQNNWFVRTIESGNELDEIKFEYYPLSFSESRKIELREGKEVNFEVKEVEYTDQEGLGIDKISWGIVK